jgi:hypothetical protein
MTQFALSRKIRQGNSSSSGKAPKRFFFGVLLRSSFSGRFQTGDIFPCPFHLPKNGICVSKQNGPGIGDPYRPAKPVEQAGTKVSFQTGSND